MITMSKLVNSIKTCISLSQSTVWVFKALQGYISETDLNYFENF